MSLLVKLSALALLSAGVVAVGLGACSSNSPKASDLVAEVEDDKFAFNCSSELLKPLAGFVGPEEVTEDKWYSQEELKKAGSGATGALWYSGKEACKALSSDEAVRNALKEGKVSVDELKRLAGTDFYLSFTYEDGEEKYVGTAERVQAASVKDGYVVNYTAFSKNLN